MTARRLSHAIAEGDGISVVPEVKDSGTARAAESAGAEGVLVYSGVEARLPEIREATGLPILFFWDGEHGDALAGADACIVDVTDPSDLRLVEHAHLELEDFELALRVRDEEGLEAALEAFDPELFVITASEDKEESPLEQLLELLAEVPAGKLVLAELPAASPAEVEELERAGADAVIVHADDVSPLVGDLPPDV